jgi:16S rRNA (cytosine1402-N4)-methyltransferase
MSFHHLTVMRDETVDALRPRDGGVYVDCTLGGGGHTERLLQKADCRVVGLDRDDDALRAASERLASFGDRFQPVHTAFSELRSALDDLGIDRVDGILADLGVSSHQLDTDDRGFSFRRSGPVDMRMDRTAEGTAADLIDRATVDELHHVLKTYGEERFARRIARAIVAGRPWSDTTALAEAVTAAMPAAQRRGRIHPATRTFQALRIAVNDELGELDALLAQSVDCLAPGARIAILSFHSLEDRLVKRFFADRSGKTGPRDPWGHPLGPVEFTVLPSATPSPTEVSGPGDAPEHANPRARSARLRVAERLPWNAP